MIARATKAASRSQSAWWSGSSAMLRSWSGWPTLCRRISEVFVWVSMSSERAHSGMRIETAPFGETTSFTKKAVSDIIGPQPASYQPRLAVGEEHLEVAVVVHGLGDLGREAQAHAADLHGQRRR